MERALESPESNGRAEAFVKTFKRDYVRVSPIPDAAAALALIDSWMEDYNTVHPLGYQSPRVHRCTPSIAKILKWRRGWDSNPRYGVNRITV